jgi:hypothetical protein
VAAVQVLERVSLTLLEMQASRTQLLASLLMATIAVQKSHVLREKLFWKRNVMILILQMPALLKASMSQLVVLEFHVMASVQNSHRYLAVYQVDLHLRRLLLTSCRIMRLE